MTDEEQRDFNVRQSWKLAYAAMVELDARLTIAEWAEGDQGDVAGEMRSQLSLWMNDAKAFGGVA